MAFIAELDFNSRALQLLALALPCAAAVALVLRRRVVAGMTMVPPLVWTVAAFLAIAAWKTAEVAAAARGGNSAWQDASRYLAATMTLAPIMAVLGAKRPQDRAWQWIVFTLLVVLSLPCAQHFALNPGGELQLHTAWRWLIAILLFTGWINYAATSFGGAATVAAAGQALLLAPYLPTTIASWLGPHHDNLGIILLSAVAISIGFFRRKPDVDAANPDRQWLEYRNFYGAAWGLRVMERFNGPARMLGWPVQLHWGGFEREGGSSEPLTFDDFSPEMLSNLQSAFRRFMPPEWIATHFRGA